MSTYLHNLTAIDRPMVCIADRTQLDRYKPSGTWLDLSQPTEALVEACRVAGLVPATMVIIDQVGLGPIMLDEDYGLIELLATFQPGGAR